MNPATNPDSLAPDSDPIRDARAEVEGGGVARADVSSSIEQPGDEIGRYKLLQFLGEGGFGTVYMAEQKEPVRRRVALKIVKLGMDTRQVIARFEAERQALAMMDHPNIAKVFDAGATETGRPYFVMELVKGIPITEFCDESHLSTKDRLELFVKVCRAVQHAHQKGIIHRDLKPSNVMVTMHDAEPVPKVIDFGIAKATNQDLTDKTLFTEFRQFIGTPEYMSPEQADLSGLDIDTRSDIYSLGVLLYELLTGAPPVDGIRLRSAAFDEIKRIIREEEAMRPSTRLSTLGESIGSLSRARGEEPAALVRALRGDLDWIVLKALEKDRVRRYETAKELAADIERHARHEPVLASPPSRVYLLRKFLRRNRGSVAAAAALVGVLLLGIAGTSSGYLRATDALRVAEDQRAAARRSEQDALAEALKQEALASFFRETLFSTSPLFGARGGTESTVTDLLRDASRRLEAGALADQPRSRATVHRALGEAYLHRELDDEAVAHFTLAIEALGDGPGGPLTLSHIAWELDRLAHDNEAEGVAVELDTDLLRTAALGSLEPLLVAGDREAVEELFRWSAMLFNSGRLAEADQVLSRVQELIPALDRRLVPIVEYARAGVLMRLDRSGEANALYERIAKPMQQGFEPDDDAFGFFEIALGFRVPGSLQAVGFTLPVMEDVLDRFRRRGTGTLMQAELESGVVWALWGAGRRAEAAERQRGVVDTALGFQRNKVFLGEQLALLGFMLHSTARHDEAFEAFDEAKRLLANHRGEQYYFSCQGVTLRYGTLALELFDGDPEAAVEPALEFLDNLGQCLSWELE
ncbi:MAG: serine/threonine protein kinase, partial [Planctomycetota bacterium]